MAEKRMKEFEKRFDDLDEGRNGLMTSEEFYRLYKELEGKDVSKEESDVMFRGIDIDGSEKISKEEFMGLVKAIVYDDNMFTYKLVFRAFDKDRSKALTIDEVKDITKYLGKEVSDYDLETYMIKKSGSKKGKITFSMLYELLTGKNIPEDTDPYDGKLKSGCCILI